MSALKALVAAGLVTSFAGCNAILGNESEYELAGSGTTSDAGGGAGDEAGGTGGEGGSGGKAGAGASAGKSGSGGKAGSTSSGGRAGGGRSAGEAGEAGESGETGSGAGEGGAGGQPACDPTGEEDCFNGRDDDCNELVDCADPACDDSVARCVPVPDDAELGSIAPGGCASGTQQITLYDGLSGPLDCEGCSCQPATSGCDSGIYRYGSYTCGQFQFEFPLYNVFNDSCTILPADPNIHYYAIRGLSTCTAVGTALPAAVTWTNLTSFCAHEELGGGCEEGYRCARAPSVPQCVLLPGSNHDCGMDYPNLVAGDWHDGYDDDRTCSDCQCGAGLSECVGGTIQIFSDSSCSGTPHSLGAAEGSACPLPFTPGSAKISGTPASNTCPPQVFPDGTFEPTGPRTLCCE